ncbi:acyltransferase family protein [Paracoccus sp. (in: a-proteobacteria)]|uniref:acyltransferase family protein n=1 Tax=Paracoccus sp. TaxID=267 RepID=UPI0035B4B9D5
MSEQTSPGAFQTSADAAGVGDQAYRTYLGRRYFGSLDGLRCLCILAVIWHHSPLMDPASPVQLLARGFVGVDMFFVLSGFLITTLLLREERDSGTISLSAFYWRRALRILPAYLLLLSAMSLYWIGVKGQHDLLPLVPYYLLFLANFLLAQIPLMSVTWSLSVEEQFYLLWPLTMLLLPLLAWRRIALLVALIVVLLAFALGAGAGLPRLQTQHAIFALPVMSYTALLSGALAAVLLNEKAGFRLFWAICGHRAAPLVYLALLLLWLQVSPENLKSWPGAVMCLLMVLFLVSLVVREDHALRPLLRFAPVRRIGEISYGIYLYHLIGLHIANELVTRLLPPGTGAEVVSTLIYLPITLVMAELSFRLFESRFLALRRRHPGGRRGPVL